MLSLVMLYGLTAKSYVASVVRRFADDRGQDFIEYALILGVISLVIIAAFLLSGVKDQVTNLSTHIACSLQGKTWTEGGVGVAGTCS
jgi:Flp pilus assembly pilin Flp